MFDEPMSPSTHTLAPDAPWIVLKFGGTSVARLSGWQSIVRLARERNAEGARVLIVVSALAGVTDALKAIAESDDAVDRREKAGALAQRHIDFAGEAGVDPALLAPWLAQLAELTAGGARQRGDGAHAWQAE